MRSRAMPVPVQTTHHSEAVPAGVAWRRKLRMASRAIGRSATRSPRHAQASPCAVARPGGHPSNIGAGTATRSPRQCRWIARGVPGARTCVAAHCPPCIRIVRFRTDAAAGVLHTHRRGSGHCQRQTGRRPASALHPEHAACRSRLPPDRASHRGAGRWSTEPRKVHSMLYTIAVVLVILWLLGLVTSYTVGGFIHVLLVIAIIMILVNFISGRRTL